MGICCLWNGKPKPTSINERTAKDKLVSRTVLDGDSAFSRMQDLAYTWVAEGTVHSIQDEMERIERVTLADVRRTLDRFPANADQTILAYGPLEAAGLGLPA